MTPIVVDYIALVEWVYDEVVAGRLERHSVVWTVAGQDAHEYPRHMNQEARELCRAVLAEHGRDFFGAKVDRSRGSLQQE